MKQESLTDSINHTEYQFMQDEDEPDISVYLKLNNDAIRKQILDMEDRMAKLPGGYISRKVIKGKEYFYYQWKESGKIRSRYIKSDELDELRQKMERKANLKEQISLKKQYLRLAAYKKRSMSRRAGLGNQSFEDMITCQNFYIDKTLFIKELWENCDAVTMITRPRRFGKTLNMDMLNCFFSVDYHDRGDLFEKLDIWKYPKYRKMQGTWPVIFLSFAGTKGESAQEILGKIAGVVKMTVQKFRYLTEDDRLQESSKRIYRELLDDLSDSEFSIRTEFALNTLCSLLYEYYGKKVIILLDEYDNPMQMAYLKGCYEEVIDRLRGFFNNLLKSNRDCFRAVVTGITQISRESIFSDLNNLVVYGMSDNLYAEYFGFTESEVINALHAQNLTDSEILDSVRKWYDGYIIGNHSHIYNPWSVAGFLKNKAYDCYWINTSSNELIGEMLMRNSTLVKGEIESLLNGEALTISLSKDIVWKNLDYDEQSLWNLMYAAGYLRAEPVYAYVGNTGIVDRTKTRYKVWLTNFEVAQMLRVQIERWFSSCRSQMNDFPASLIGHDTEGMTRIMNELTLQMFSVFDAGRHPSEKRTPERFYHGFVLGLLVDLREQYEIVSNRESGYGRYDIAIIPFDKQKEAFLMEFKVFDPSKEKNLNETCENALTQICNQQYKTEILRKGFREQQIRSYGFGFEGKKVLIQEGQYD